MKLTNDQLTKLQKQCQESNPFPVFPEVKSEKGKEKEAEAQAKAYRAANELYDSLREVLPVLVDELLSKRHKLNE